MADSKIEWTDKVWNPVRGCEKISPGCKNCYAETFAERWRGIKGHPYEQGFDLKLIPHKIEEPLKWRGAHKVFVNSMSDLFQKGVPTEFIDKVFAVMQVCGIQRWFCRVKRPDHDCGMESCAASRAEDREAYGPLTFQILTKRPERMHAYLNDPDVWFRVEEETEKMGLSGALEGQDVLVGERGNAYLKNVWLGVSVEDEASFKKRVPLLLDTPAAIRWLSCEPLLEHVELHDAFWKLTRDHTDEYESVPLKNRIDWVVLGGESGRGARSCNIRWLLEMLGECEEAGVPAFLKQLGAKPVDTDYHKPGCPNVKMHLEDPKGGDMTEWPEKFPELRVRQFPKVKQLCLA